MRIAVAADPRLRTSRSQDPMVDRFAAPMHYWIQKTNCTGLGDKVQRLA